MPFLRIVVQNYIYGLGKYEDVVKKRSLSRKTFCKSDLKTIWLSKVISLTLLLLAWFSKDIFLTSIQRCCYWLDLYPLLVQVHMPNSHAVMTHDDSYIYHYIICQGTNNNQSTWRTPLNRIISCSMLWKASVLILIPQSVHSPHYTQDKDPNHFL